jgi:hypothetical protein
MIRFSQKGPKVAAIFLSLALGAPTRTLAQSAVTPQSDFSENSAGAVTQNPARLGAAAEAQLLDKEEIATLSQRNQNPGPEVRGGALSNEHLTYIVIALAAIVLVLVLK